MAEVVIRELRKARTLKSASWAAYGDALGFITELASPSIIRRRIGSTTAQVTVPWTRLIGGRMGAEVPLPAGSYSDDTQLRLATSRAIRGDGAFDVESFAKVELPIWLTYALGAGRGTKAAAENLAGKKATWFSNFFSSAGSEYVNGGGNGAAMRVQPHVWASPRLSEPEFLPDVIRNAICTHGHVRGIAGAMIHAASLASVLMDGVVEEPRSWLRYSGVIRRLPEIISRDSDLSTFWLPTWESVSGRSLEEEVIEVSEEWNAAVHQVIELN